MPAAKKKATVKKAAAPKKVAAKKKAVTKKTATKKAVDSAVTGNDMDRKGLAARARQLKTELLAIRFNLQSPSLNEYRKKKKELQSVLARLA